MEAKGKIYEITPTTQVTESFTKRELILEMSDNPKFVEYVKFEAAQDKCDILDSFKMGDEVEIFFNLRGRPWSDKTGKKSYFNSLQLWKVNKLESGSTPQYAPPANMSSGNDLDDLPFS